MMVRELGCIAMNRQQLIEDNIKLVYLIVSKEYPTFFNDEDIIQSGMVGLCLAAEKWDETKSKFSTYAGQCIRNEIRREFQKRKKYGNPLSLDKSVKNDGDDCTFADFIIGNEDVDYVDFESFYDVLTPREKEVISLLQEGYKEKEIANKLQLARQVVNKYKRRALAKWRNFYGNN